MLEDVAVAGWSAIDEPGNPLETNSSIDNLDGELFVGPVREVLVLHEHHVADFESADEVLHGGAEVASTGPDVLDEGDFIGVDFKLLGEPAVIELDALILEEDVLVRVVEDLYAEHDEARVVTAGEPDVVQIIEPDGELGTDKWIRGGF